MVINVIWNRGCGLGGGTRRLHHGCLWGRSRIDVPDKEIIFTQYDTAGLFVFGSKQ